MLLSSVEKVGKATLNGIEEVGYWTALIVESLYWIFIGPRVKQPVHASLIFHEMVNIGVKAIPIVAVLAFTNGVMLAIQGIYALEDFGAESEVIPSLGLSVAREFGVLIVGIVVAGRSGSSIAARIGAMQMSQEIDALRVMGVNPVRYLVAPIMIAMVIMFPALTILANTVALLGGGLLTALQLDINLATFTQRILETLEAGDLMQGLSKSLVFAVLLTVVSVSNGFSISGGAEGLGRYTTRSVVMCISVIVVADMIFTFYLSR